MKRLGIDIGSRKVKFALQIHQATPKLWEIPTSILYHNHLKRHHGTSHELDFESLGLEGLDVVAATGYGRNNVKLSNVLVISEMLAHAEGALRSGKQNFVMLDVGGQDTKVVLVENGMVEDFLVNDKCAAGSGRYLENMAEVIGVKLENLFEYYADPADLSTTCAVYAESEIISKLADGISIEQLCAGVNHSTFLRIRPMLERWQDHDLVFVGGGAKNSSIVHYLKEDGFQVTIPDYPEFNGALGCLKMLDKEKEL